MNATKSRTSPSHAATVATVTAIAATAPASLASDAALLRTFLTDAGQQYRGPGMRDLLRAIVIGLICPAPVNVLAVGLPGTAKTSVVRAIGRATGLSFLARTLSPWTDAAELLGGVDIPALATGVVRRVIDAAHVSMLNASLILFDEFPRSAPGIRAMVMSALSDRLTPTDDPVPAHVIVAGANTRLTSEEDKATVDRFTLRVEVPRLLNPNDLRTVITRRVTVDGRAPTAAHLPALPQGLVLGLRAQASAVDLTGDVADAMVKLILATRQAAPGGVSYPDISERRWEIASLILQASATLNGRTSVDWSDFVETLPMVLDDGPESRAAIKNAIDASVPAWVAALKALEDACTNAVARARRVGGADATPGIDPMRGDDAKDHAKVHTEFDQLVGALKSYGADVAKRAEERAERARDEVTDAFNAAVDAARAARKASR